ncbi:hypothetical protein NFI96_002329 [Prochilodus magdalenae]|nr:hypothetical protein NFI96_002329 [Prochilodus magdalenae]
MARCIRRTGCHKKLFMGTVILCLVGLNQILLKSTPERECACMQCMGESEKDPWFAERYRSLVPKLLSRQNSELSANTSKWWRERAKT